MYTIGVLIVSDKGSRGEREDLCGAVIKEVLADFGKVEYYHIVADERALIQEQLIYMCDNLKLNLVLTSGGTGFSPRDVTPEATWSVVDKVAPGISGAILAANLEKTPRAMLSRAISGIRRRSLIINLPGSPKGARESLEVVLEPLGHGLDILLGKSEDCGKK
ncbi:MAG: MogA/MoaB family molybdenum cofactor biosynthesis protein [Syntrophomonadaceae bacterium]|nr:MogA/MoaB family molybdenum cofactor biosynthesis protein [Syntrophomonadaceae bacterium]